MKISFIEPRAPDTNIFSKAFIPRLGTITLATILRKQGHDVKVFIERYNVFNSIDYDFIKLSNLVCISTITSTAPRAYAIAKKLRKEDFLIVMGGVHPTFMVEEALEYCDYVVRHEGDETILELVDCINTSNPEFKKTKCLNFLKDLRLIKGLSYKYVANKVVNNPDRPLIENLNSIPIPDLSLIHKWSPSKIYPISTSRGCPFDCNFCSVVSMFGCGFRTQSISRICEEWKIADSIIKQNATIFFVDDNFTVNRKRLELIIKKMLSNGIKHKWSAQVSIDIAKKPKLLDLMAKAGCKRVYIGLESINNKTLKILGKKQTVKDIENGIKVIKNFGIDVHGMFIFGADTDDKSIFKQTAKFAIKNKIDTVQFIMLIPLPGTKLFEEMKKNNRLLHTDWSKYDGHHVVFSPKNMTAQELQINTLKAMARFYSWKYIFKHLIRFHIFYALAGLKGRQAIKKAIKESKKYFKNFNFNVSESIT